MRSPGADAFKRGMAESVRRLAQSGKRVLVIDPVPIYHYPLPAALAQRWRRGGDLDALGQPVAQYLAHQASALALVDQLTATGAAQRVAVRPILCGAERCAVLDGQHSLYFDDNHLSMHGAARVASAVLRAMEAP